MKKIFEYLLHASTWKGLLTALSGLGILSMDMGTGGTVTASGLLIKGLINILVDDHDVDKLS